MRPRLGDGKADLPPEAEFGSGSVRARPGPAGPHLAKRLVRVVEERGPVHEDDLSAILRCDWGELRAAIAIAFHWRRVDRCGDSLVAVPSREGRPTA